MASLIINKVTIKPMIAALLIPRCKLRKTNTHHQHRSKLKEKRGINICPIKENLVLPETLLKQFYFLFQHNYLLL